MRFRNIVLGFGIFIVYLLVLFQGVETFFPGPMYEDYCEEEFRAKPYSRECAFSNELRTKENTCFSQGAQFVYEYNDEGCPIDGYCDDCRIDYGKDRDTYANKLFLFSVSLGIVVFLFGLYLLKKEPVGSALVGSAIFTVVYGTARNWRNFTESWRFLILFILLVALIWIALSLESVGRKKGWKFNFWKRK